MILILYLSIVTSLFFPAVVISDIEWQELRGDHFIVYFVENKKFATDVLWQAEKYYRRIADELGYERYSNFWQWDKRVKIYIYKNREDYLKNTGQKKWSEGMADYGNKTIISYAWNKDFLEALLPHEMTHLIFRDYVGFKGEIPVWLDEGVAQWQEPAKRSAVKFAIREMVKRNSIIPLDKLMRMDIRMEKDEELVDAYYIESISLVEFLITRYGSRRFIGFCRQLRDGKSMNEALRFSYPTSIRSIEALEKEWKRYILEDMK